MSAEDDKRIAEMLKGRRAVRQVPFPAMWENDDAPFVGVHVLSGRELDDAGWDAMQYIQARAKEKHTDPLFSARFDPEAYEEDKRRCTIFRAFVKLEGVDKEGDPLKHFTSPEAVRQLDQAIIDALWLLYRDHQQHVNPLRDDITEERAGELADALGKPEQAQTALATLSQFDVSALRTLLRTSALLLQASLSGKFSTSPSSAQSSTVVSAEFLNETQNEMRDAFERAK